jgi:hypothetical protein
LTEDRSPKPEEKKIDKIMNNADFGEHKVTQSLGTELHRGIRGFDLNAKSRKVLREVAQRGKEEKGKR